MKSKKILVSKGQETNKLAILKEAFELIQDKFVRVPDNDTTDTNIFGLSKTVASESFEVEITIRTKSL